MIVRNQEKGRKNLNTACFALFQAASTTLLSPLPKPDPLTGAFA